MPTVSNAADHEDAVSDLTALTEPQLGRHCAWVLTHLDDHHDDEPLVSASRRARLLRRCGRPDKPTRQAATP